MKPRTLEERRTYGRVNSALYRKRHRNRIMWWSAKIRAKQKNISFDISYSDIKIPKFCSILNIPLDRRDRNHTPTLDRVITTKGYIKGNICVISNKANNLKNDASIEELEAILRYMKGYL